MDLSSSLLFGNTYITILIVLSLLVVYWYKTIPANLPPGPIGLPIVGYLPFMRRPAQLAFNHLAQTYGPIFHMYLGGKLVVVLNDYATIKEAFVKQGDVFSGRIHDSNFFKTNQQRIGIVNVDGESWRQHRRFVMSNLRDNGIGKASLEPLLLNEIHCFVDELKKVCGKPTGMNQLLSLSLLNNTHILVTGNRYDYDNKTFLNTFNAYFELITQLSRQCNKELLEITKEIINNMKNYQNNLQYENLADAYMAEMQNQNKQDKTSHFSVAGLLQTCRDLLVAGTETSAKTLLWGMIYLTNNPHVQSKVQDEIDRVIGRERDPSYNDRSNTPYTLATINEIHRMASLVPISLPHRVIRDTNLLGYHIPKDTLIFPNLWSVHYDPKLWGDPDTFRPERFLSPHGQLNTPEYLIPFSIGKRACAGEPLARMELYLYFTSFMQNFKLVSPDGCKLSLESTQHLSRFPLTDVISIENR